MGKLSYYFTSIRFRVKEKKMSDRGTLWYNNVNYFIRKLLDEKYRVLFQYILDTKDKVDITYNTIPYTYHLIQNGAAVLALWKLNEMYGNCGILVSHGAYVYHPYRNKGLGKLLNQFRIDFAKALGYSILLCTDIESNLPQRHILTKNGWIDILKFINRRTNNINHISYYNLENEN